MAQGSQVELLVGQGTGGVKAGRVEEARELFLWVLDLDGHSKKEESVALDERHH